MDGLLVMRKIEVREGFVNLKIFSSNNTVASWKSVVLDVYKEIGYLSTLALEQGFSTLVLKGHYPAEFSSNPVAF